METFLETPRLLLRPIEQSDAQGLFLLDSNPRVHLFLGNNPVKSIDAIHDVISHIHQQYQKNGIGRWAVIEKSSGDFIGWCGLKLEKNVNGRATFYDFGYRLREEFWGKGFATESGKRWIEFGFQVMNLPLINAYVSAGNAASRQVLQKCGLQHTESFTYESSQECWYEIRNPEFRN